MSEMYRPYKIPSKNPSHSSEAKPESYNSNPAYKPDLSFSRDQGFAEIEITDTASSSYKSAPVPSPINPAADPKRRLFKEMREIAWNNHSSYVYNLKFYNRNTQHENSRVFYKQAIFMKDFEDDYTDWVSFSSYYPYYQLMNYEQLRTYFSWRTLVRKGIVEEVSLSYAFVYIYELLNNIGVDDPADGLKKLMAFRKAFKRYDATIDKYLINWIKDYYVYYQPEGSFKDFIYEYNLEGHFPEILDYEPDLKADFESLCELSKYNIRQSAFYKSNSSLVMECLEFVINRLKSIFAGAGLNLYNIIYEVSSKKAVWTPFKGALFYPTLKQPFKKIILSFNEVYICSQNMWFFTCLVCTDSGKQLMTYIFKHTEAVLRKITGYKYKLSAGTDIIDCGLLQMLAERDISIEKSVTEAVRDFYREKNKIVVSVDPNTLSKIRTEAMYTLQKLIVPEDKSEDSPVKTLDLFSWLADSPTDDSLSNADTAANTAISAVSSYSKNLAASAFTVSPTDEKTNQPAAPLSAGQPVSPFLSSGQSASPSLASGWTSLKQALTDVEIAALSAVLQGRKDMKQFADEHGIMLEVLADSINEKAFDHIGDNILELNDSMIIYDEYIENVKAMVKTHE